MDRDYATARRNDERAAILMADDYAPNVSALAAVLEPLRKGSSRSKT